MILYCACKLTMNLNLYIIIEAATLVLMLHEVCPTLAAFRKVASATFKKTYVAGDNITSYSTGKEVGRSIIQCSDLCKTDGNQCAGFRFDGESCHFYSAVDPALFAPAKSEEKPDAFYFYDRKDCHAYWESGHRESGVYRLSPPGVQSFLALCEFDDNHGWISDPKDCHAYWEIGHRESGVYGLSPPGGVQSFLAPCEFDDNHGWTVIQRRLDGSQDFFLYWSDYKNGFGNVSGEYWLGNEKIFSLTRINRRLSIYMMRWDGDEATANYSNFYISNESDNYRLNISGYSGNVGYDGMAYSNGYQFTTRDRDYDGHSGIQCADYLKGAWWYNACARSNLNGLYANSSTGNFTNMNWYGDWSGGSSRPLRMTTMMISRD